MKYSVFALFALSLFLVASCQNNSGADGSGSTSGNEAGALPSIEPSSDPNKLSEQIMTDYLEAKAFSKKFTPIYDTSFVVIKTMKMTGSPLGESERAKILPMIEEAMKFRLAYEEHQRCIEQLDSISIKISKEAITIEEAQKEYLNVRKRLGSSAAVLPAEQGTIQQVKSKFEQAFPGAVSQ